MDTVMERIRIRLPHDVRTKLFGWLANLDTKIQNYNGSNYDQIIDVDLILRSMIHQFFTSNGKKEDLLAAYQNIVKKTYVRAYLDPYRYESEDKVIFLFFDYSQYSDYLDYVYQLNLTLGKRQGYDHFLTVNEVANLLFYDLTESFLKEIEIMVKDEYCPGWNDLKGKARDMWESSFD
jgi:hypothetical protein